MSRLSRLAEGLSWVVIAAACAVLAVAVAVPRMAGATPYAVLTGSMSPDVGPGSLVVVRPTQASEISVGDVITFQLRSGKQPVATHRVVAVGFDDEAGRIFQTQGDANASPDAEWVREVQIRGRVWYSAPFLGHVHTALSGSQRGLMVQIAAAALLGYAGWAFVSSARDRRARQRGARDHGQKAAV